MGEPSAREMFLSCANGETGDIADGALWLAVDDFPNLDIAPYRALLDEAGDAYRRKTASLSLSNGSTAGDAPLYLEAMLDVLSAYLPIRGAGGGDPRQHYLHKVIDRKQGVPLLCSVVWCAVAARAGVQFESPNLPGHVLLKIGPLYVDPHLAGHQVDENDLIERCASRFGLSREEACLRLRTPATNRDILARMSRNLRGCYAVRQQWKLALRSADRSVSLLPDDPAERRDRGIVRWQAGRIWEALEDLQYYCDHAAGASDVAKIESIVQQLTGQTN